VVGFTVEEDAMRKLSFLDVASARSIGPEAVSEVSLARVWQHAQDAGATSFGILSAFHGARGKETQHERDSRQHQNHKRQAELRRDVDAWRATVQKQDGKKRGYFPLKGHWTECQDDTIPWTECPPELLVKSDEETLFINGISLDELDKLGRKYEQQAWIYAGPETDGTAILYGPGRQKYRDLGAFHPNRIAQGYSEIRRGASFAFEDSPSGFFEGLLQLSSKKPGGLNGGRERAEAVLRDLREFYGPCQE
jgi:hypothetical protein